MTPFPAKETVAVVYAAKIKNLQTMHETRVFHNLKQLEYVLFLLPHPATDIIPYKSFQRC